MLDAGVRANAVHNDYLAGRNWQKRAAVEASGFGLATAGGIAAGVGIVEAGLSIAMLATPVGWVFIIGSSIAVGIVAAKVGDGNGQGIAGYLYDKSSILNWF